MLLAAAREDVDRDLEVRELAVELLLDGGDHLLHLLGVVHDDELEGPLRGEALFPEAVRHEEDLAPLLCLHEPGDVAPGPFAGGEARDEVCHVL